MGLRKGFPLPITEESRFQFRFDFFNILNRSNFAVTSRGGVSGLGVTNIHNPNNTQFGQVSSTFAAREIQVGMKLTF